MFNDYNGSNPDSIATSISGGDPLYGKARIKVIGVGGAGNNAVNRMITAGIKSAEFYVVNTDSQVLTLSACPNKIQIGGALTKGLGAGADPEIGRAAAEESKDLLTDAVKDADLLFITAGMGGGTGTGAAPVIAKIARDLKILTVAVVTEPFGFEGRIKMENAAKGLDNLKKYVDTLIIVPNDKIRTVVPKNTPMAEALKVADEILKQGIKGIAELIVNPSLINLDFADVKTILKDKGIAHLGVGVAKGENRIIEAVRVAVNCPLLETTIEGARGVILNVCGGQDLTFDEVSDAAELVRGVVAADANIIFGARIDPNVHDEVEITVIATGFPGFDNKQNDAQQRAYKSGVLYDHPGYNSPQQAQRPSVNGPYYPNQTLPQQPTQPQPPVQPIRRQQTNYSQQPAAPQNNTVNQYPQNQYPQQYVQPAPQQQAPVQQQQQQPPVPPVTQNQAATPVQNEGEIERPVNKEIPKFIQALKKFGNRNND